MDPTSSSSLNPPKGRLPAEIAATLDPREQNALDHRIRREILRQLLARNPQSPRELALAISSVSLSAVQYQLSVLAKSGILSIVGSGEASGGEQRLYMPSVGNEDRILEVLRTMKKQDSDASRRPRDPLLSPRRLISIWAGRRSR